MFPRLLHSARATYNLVRGATAKEAPSLARGTHGKWALTVGPQRDQLGGAHAFGGDTGRLPASDTQKLGDQEVEEREGWRAGSRQWKHDAAADSGPPHICSGVWFI